MSLESFYTESENNIKKALETEPQSEILKRYLQLTVYDIINFESHMQN